MICRMHMVYRIVDYLKKRVLSKFGLYNAQSSQNALMKQYGLEILEIFHNVSEELNKPIWLEFGTLLGAYRNHSFISYDYDMDLGMYSDQYDIDFENSLIEKGLVDSDTDYYKVIYRGGQLKKKLIIVASAESQAVKKIVEEQGGSYKVEV